MQIGISLQNNWGIEDVQALVQLATRAETLGQNCRHPGRAEWRPVDSRRGRGGGRAGVGGDGESLCRAGGSHR
jgi:hypothetical protein